MQALMHWVWVYFTQDPEAFIGRSSVTGKSGASSRDHHVRVSSQKESITVANAEGSAVQQQDDVGEDQPRVFRSGECVLSCRQSTFTMDAVPAQHGRLHACNTARCEQLNWIYMAWMHSQPLLHMLHFHCQLSLPFCHLLLDWSFAAQMQDCRCPRSFPCRQAEHTHMQSSHRYISSTMVIPEPSLG